MRAHGGVTEGGRLLRLVAVALGVLVAFAVVSGTLGIAQKQLGLRVDEFANLLAAVATAIAFAFGIYLAILAISAYAHVKELETTSKTSRQFLDDMQKIREDGETNLRTAQDSAHSCQEILEKTAHTSRSIYAQSDLVIQSMLNYLRASRAPSSSPRYDQKVDEKIKEMIKMLFCERARIMLNNPWLEADDKITHILVLRDYKEKSAIGILESLSSSDEERSEVRNAAREALQEIRKDEHAA